MKKAIAIILLFPFSLLAQNKISGLGPFKIGQTLSSKIASFADTSKGRLYYAEPADSFTERWSAGYYQIAGMWIEDLDLKFYKDTLYSIACKYSDSLKMALVAKYGQGAIKSDQKNIKCRTGLKVSYDEQEKTFFTYYPTNSKDISAWTVVGKWFNDKCEPEYLFTYNIISNRVEKKVDALIEAKQRKEERDKQAVLKNKLGNF